MNGSEYPDASKGGMRKGIIIGIVVIVTAASFTLGFFVGKLTGSREETLPALVEVAKPKPPEAPIQHESAPVNTVSQTPLTLTVEKTDVQKSVVPPASIQGAASEKPEKTARRGAVKEETPAAAASSPRATPKKEIIYTVQLGAFKSQSEAEQVKAKFDKKGYMTYITAVKNKGGKIFKVRTGEFREKQDAEILSLKLKKADGLTAFVTFRNE